MRPDAREAVKPPELVYVLRRRRIPAHVGPGHAAECVMPQRQQEASVTSEVMKSFQTSAQPGQTAASGCREGFVRHQQSLRTDEPKWHRQQQFEIGVYRRER
jgi:hypothetical protein